LSKESRPEGPGVVFTPKGVAGGPKSRAEMERRSNGVLKIKIGPFEYRDFGFVSNFDACPSLEDPDFEFLNCGLLLAESG
jgi:hypothetical protein